MRTLFPPSHKPDNRRSFYKPFSEASQKNSVVNAILTNLNLQWHKNSENLIHMAFVNQQMIP